nr:MAG TPA: hypothetical protein [Caudoviricetes sp.]
MPEYISITGDLKDFNSHLGLCFFYSAIFNLGVYSPLTCCARL